MALEERIFTLSYEADAAIGQYLLVGPGVAARSCKLPAAAGDVVYGATLNRATAQGQALAVAAGGIIKVEAGAVLALGSKVMADTDGQAIAATATKFVCGIAITASTAIGQVIEVHWLGSYQA